MLCTFFATEPTQVDYSNRLHFLDTSTRDHTSQNEFASLRPWTFPFVLLRCTCNPLTVVALAISDRRLHPTSRFFSEYSSVRLNYPLAEHLGDHSSPKARCFSIADVVVTGVVFSSKLLEAVEGSELRNMPAAAWYSRILSLTEVKHVRPPMAVVKSFIGRFCKFIGLQLNGMSSDPIVR